ncbi:murF protein [Lactobacillus selangorensis]|uniref:UDP-N-acetylmuramoyl-tripeptide--D-alanyl-D-alanine ligase n=1 Tax=Lactobacillus selangorensis TaxID=81857 RepID=A0A0R2FS32_9LACO|nr:UDP-N-acetylmuramoyl-tripeptide--D-alanyl-D-alanine ligase [Lactobacillus selangorensis]KRN27884.1 murF protein [Lactobacillus selangorensis]KRN30645.1 murF protein [Lactobacillus selangorensis]
MKMQLAEIARAVDAENDVSQWAEVEISSVEFDTRKLEPGALFVPLEGTRDGHDFVQNAVQKGAAATLWQTGHADLPTNIPVVVVADPLKAFQKLARYYLLKVNPKVVAITGSNGKTTTKDMTAAILKTQFNVHKTQENFNNEIGVPMTILGMETNTEVLVVEMGMDRPGQLDFLSKLVQPDVAVITMIGEAHIEFFGTRAKIADAKMEITHGLKEDGELVYNGDEPLLNERVTDLKQQQRTFGSLQTNTLYPTQIESGKTATNFKVNLWPDTEFSIPMMGAYNVNNALAAMLVAKHFHVKQSDMQSALAHFALTENRTEWYHGKNDADILSDVYNANPTAMREVLRTFSQMPTDGKRIAVLGDMLELGDESKPLHESIARVLDPEKIQIVYLYGTEMKALADKLANLYAPENVRYYPEGQQGVMIESLLKTIQPGDLVVLKASHGMHLENVLAALQ